MLSLEHLISFSFAAEEVKGVNYFPSRANDQFENVIDVIDKRLVNSVNTSTYPYD